MIANQLNEINFPSRANTLKDKSSNKIMKKASTICRNTPLVNPQIKTLHNGFGFVQEINILHKQSTPLVKKCPWWRIAQGNFHASAITGITHS